MGIFYFIHVPVRQSDQMKWDPIDFDVYFLIFLIYISSFFICFLLLQLMKIESDELQSIWTKTWSTAWKTAMLTSIPPTLTLFTVAWHHRPVNPNPQRHYWRLQ